jgi:tRNA nucleotidyltransferase (CCA-adding enzyme)
MPPPAERPRTGHATFDHGADIGVSGWGPTPAAAFEQAAVALTSVICEPSWVRPVEAVRLEAADDDLELLLYAWLHALVYEMASRNMLFSRFEVGIEDGRLSAVAHGEPVDVARHAPAVEVKGPTMTELEVGQQDDGTWHARCVVDV